jgi:serine/threonine protein kinase
MPLELNSLLHGRYRIGEELGRGGMGAVYRGHDENLGVEVAIKENQFSTPEFERQFKREASLLATLRHPNLPRVTDHFVLSGQGQYLVMDFIPGDDAKAKLTKNGGPLPEKDVVKWAREILDALKYLHGRTPPILHRDIKPGNIKITPDGRAVLVDFGLAKMQDNTQTATTTGAKAFTPGFAPPEQYGLGRTDARTDFYAWGATLYNLLTGDMPADGLQRALNQQNLIPIQQLNPKVSARAAQAIERSLGIRPDERFASAAEFISALPDLDEYTAPARPSETVMRPVPPKPEPKPEPVAPTVTSPPPQRNLLPLILGGVGVLVVLGAIGVGAMMLGAGRLNSDATPTSQPTVQVGIATATTAPPTATTEPTATTVPPTDVPTTEPTATEVPPTPTLAGPQATPLGGGVNGQLAFVSERSGSPQIWLMNADGSNPVQITNQQDGACQPAWAPDGSQLVFVSPCPRKRDTYPGSAIYKINADGTGSQILFSLIGGVYDPDWSVAGIAMTYLDNNRPQIYLGQPDGSRPVRLSQERSGDSQPTWAFDGTKLIFFNTSRTGQPILYWMNQDGTFDGSNPNQVTRDLAVSQPTWAPSGDLVAFVVSQQIYVIPWDARGFGAQKLTVTGPNDTPAWSPDGGWIAYESWREAANHDVWIMNRNGGEQKRLTTDPAWDYQPAWRP